jgi:ADP-ribose pyrophosphatase YjhB (NUDIX family)
MKNNMLKIERIRTGVKAFIVHAGKILVVKEKVRREGEEVILHDLPGGGVELGESLHEALHREVFEEVGLKIEVTRPVGSWEFVVDTYENPETGVHMVCLGYQCKLLGEPKVDTTNNPAQEDIFDTFWLSKDEILSSSDILKNQDLRHALGNVRID